MQCVVTNDLFHRLNPASTSYRVPVYRYLNRRIGSAEHLQPTSIIFSFRHHIIISVRGKYDARIANSTYERNGARAYDRIGDFLSSPRYSLAIIVREKRVIYDETIDQI